MSPWLIGSPHPKRPRRRLLPPERIAARMVERTRNANRQGDGQRGRRRLPAEARDLIPFVEGVIANSLVGRSLDALSRKLTQGGVGRGVGHVPWPRRGHP
jgi:hypothetical protein